MMTDMPDLAPGRGGRQVPRTAASHPARQGKIEVSPQAIAALAGHAVIQCYGVVGITTRRSRLGLLPLLPPDRYAQGIGVRFTNDHIAIDVFVVLEHGLRVSEIAHNLIKDVKYEVEQALGLRVVEVNVTIQALRVSERTA